MDRNKLNILKQALEDGPVCCTAYLIWKWAGMGKIDAATHEWNRDGDKVSDKNQKEAIKSLIGCRTHNIVDCKHEWCKY